MLGGAGVSALDPRAPRTEQGHRKKTTENTRRRTLMNELRETREEVYNTSLAQILEKKHRLRNIALGMTRRPISSIKSYRKRQFVLQ